MQWFVFLLGRIFFATIGAIIEKKTLFKEHAMEFCAVFALFVAGISAFYIPFLNLNFPAYYWLIIFFLAWLDAIAFLYIAKAVRHMQISQVSPLLAFGPALTAIVAFFAIGEHLSLRQLGGIGLIISGSYILELRHGKKLREEMLAPIRVMLQSKYIHYIFVALSLHAVSSVVSRFLLNSSNAVHVEPLTFLTLIQLFIALHMLILIYVFHDGWQGVVHGAKTAGKWIALMALVMVAGRALLVMAMALPAAKIALVTSFQRMTGVLTTIVGGEIFHEKNLKQKIIAALVMVLGSFLIVL